jgi:hypothetical protein
MKLKKKEREKIVADFLSHVFACSERKGGRTTFLNKKEIKKFKN